MIIQISKIFIAAIIFKITIIPKIIQNEEDVKNKKAFFQYFS